MKRIKTLATTLCTLSLAIPALATPPGTLYRYKDSQGLPVISHTLPSDMATKGYDIMNAQGRVLETVPAEPTSEERIKRAAEAAAQLQQAEERKAQMESDHKLRRFYSHPDDVIRALNRKLQEMYDLIKLKQSNITLLTTQLEQEQEAAANLERAGRQIPENALLKMRRLHTRIQELAADIVEQEGAISNTRDDYDRQTTRLETLLGKKRTLQALQREQLEDGAGASH